MKYDIPELPEGHALIKLSHCGISQMDIDTYTGREPKVVPPRVLGNEICGIVKQINSPDVPSELEGTRVAVDPVIGCGQCSECIAGNSNHCENLEVIGLTCNGGFAEYVIVPVKNLYPLPDKAQHGSPSTQDGFRGKGGIAEEYVDSITSIFARPRWSSYINIIFF